MADQADNQQTEEPIGDGTIAPDFGPSMDEGVKDEAGSSKSGGPLHESLRRMGSYDEQAAFLKPRSAPGPVSGRGRTPGGAKATSPPPGAIGPAAVTKGAAAVTDASADTATDASAGAVATRWKRRPSGGVYGTVIVGGKKQRLGGRKLQLVDGATVGRLLRKGKIPSELKYEVRGKGNIVVATGDLLADAADGSELTTGRGKARKRWIRSGGTWEKYKNSRFYHHRGVRFSGGPKVGEALLKMRDEGTLKIQGVDLPLTNEQIAVIDGISKAESGGKLGAVWTADNMFISLGFKQVVLGWGSLQRIMKRAPEGFAKHGLAVGSGKYSMSKYKKHGKIGPKSYEIIADGEIRSPMELRKALWAARFYKASLEPDVVAAQAEYCIEQIGVVKRQIKRSGALRGGRGKGAKFWDDPTVLTWLAEIKNNRPAWVGYALRVAKGRGINGIQSRDRFLNVLRDSILYVYGRKGPKSRKLGKNILTNLGRHIKVPKTEKVKEIEEVAQ